MWLVHMTFATFSCNNKVNCVLVTDIFPYLMLFAFLAFINFSYIRLFVIVSTAQIGSNVNFTFALMTLD